MVEDNNQGLNKLARVMQDRMGRNMGANSELLLDFGEVLPDYSLKTNTFAIPIPVTDYHVLRQQTLGDTDQILTKTQDIGMPHSGNHIHNTIDLTDSMGGAVTGTVGEATGPAPPPTVPAKRSDGGDGADGMHQHHVLIPEKLRKIKPGDRVLVAWVQSEAVIIDIILPGTELTK